MLYLITLYSSHIMLKKMCYTVPKNKINRKTTTVKNCFRILLRYFRTRFKISICWVADW